MLTDILSPVVDADVLNIPELLKGGQCNNNFACCNQNGAGDTVSLPFFMDYSQRLELTYTLQYRTRQALSMLPSLAFPSRLSRWTRLAWTRLGHAPKSLIE